MPTKIFISASPQHDSEHEWASSFSRAVAEAAGYSEDEVFLYTQQRLARDIPADVRKRISEANRMICLMSSDYLQSGWCALEHMLFTTKNDGSSGDCVGVYQPFLHDWVGTSEENKQRYIDFGIECIRGKKQVPITLDLETHLQGEWRRWLLKAQHVDFHHFERWPSTLRAEDAERMRQLADPPTTIDSLLMRYTSLCVFALGADRYHDGGWGFSLGHSFDFDQYDGDELPRGRYDAAVIILAALSAFLDSKTLIEEWSKVFEGTEGERQPRIQVGDRLPTLAALLCCLASQGRLGADVRNRPLEEILAQLGAGLPASRWTLLQERNGAELLDYRAMLLVCLKELQLSAEKLVGRHKRMLEDEGAAGEIDAGCEAAETTIATLLKNHSLFSIALERSTDFLSGSGSPKESQIKSDLHVATLWLLLTLTEDSAALLDTHLGKTTGRSWVKRLFEPLVTNFRQVLERDRPDLHVLGLMLCCAAVMSAEGIDIEDRKVDFERLVTSLLGHPEIDDRLLRLNVIAWVALTLFAQRSSGRPLDGSLLSSMWERGLALRKERNHAIGQGLAASDVRKAIEAQVKESAFSAFRSWQPSGSNSQSAKQEAKLLGRFLESVLAASFWGPRPSLKAAVDESGGPEASLTGVLRVRAKTRKVELETPGYNKMFLHPFSEITAVNVFNLRSMRREFGDLDEDLVRLMGETVVESCYERFKDEFIRSSRTFEERTTYITDQLTSDEWDAARGFDDLLLVKSGEKGHRWIYRTAVMQEPPGGVDDRFDDRVISWRFVEMPRSISQLVSDDARVREFPNDRRS